MAELEGHEATSSVSSYMCGEMNSLGEAAGQLAIVLANEEGAELSMQARLDECRQMRWETEESFLSDREKEFLPAAKFIVDRIFSAAQVAAEKKFRRQHDAEHSFAYLRGADAPAELMVDATVDENTRKVNRQLARMESDGASTERTLTLAQRTRALLGRRSLSA